MNLFSWKHSAIGLLKHISNNNKFKWIKGSMALSCQNLASKIYRRLFGFAFSTRNPSCILGKNRMETYWIFMRFMVSNCDATAKQKYLNNC